MTIFSTISNGNNAIYPFLLANKLLNIPWEKQAVGTWNMYHDNTAVVAVHLPLSAVATALSPHLWPSTA